MFEDRPILIVEDECYVALDLANAVEDWRGRVVGPVATVAEALQLLEARAVSAAILDSELADGDVTPLALELSQRGVPLVIHTETGLPAELASKLPRVPIVRKPVRPLVVLERLLEEIRRTGSEDLRVAGRRHPRV